MAETNPEEVDKAGEAIIEGEGIKINPDLPPTAENKSENISQSSKVILKKPSALSKKHIIDELNLNLPKKPPTHFTVTPPAKSNTKKNFIQKNIKRSNEYLTSLKSTPTKDNSSASDLIDPSQKRKTFDIKERFYTKAETSKKKIEELKDKYDQEELLACTFQPKTNNKEKPKLNTAGMTAKLDEYLKKQREKQEKAVEEAKRTAEQAENAENLSYQPKICEKSKEILLSSKRPTTELPIHERLYNNCKPTRLTPDPETESQKLEDPFFHPTINKKSQNLSRPSPIQNILYEDAKRRQNPPKIATSPTPKYMGAKSEKFLIEKFKREFSDALIETETEINYSRFLEIYKSLFFIREEREDVDRLTVLTLWRSFLVTEEGSVVKEDVLAASLAILGFFEDWMSTDPGKMKFTKNEVKMFHKKYEQLYKNRTVVTLKSSVNQSFKNVVELSFQPERIAQSDELAEKWRSTHREPGRIEEALLAEKLKKEKKLNELKQRVEEEELRECSFKPKTEELPAIYAKSDKAAEVEAKTHKGLELYGLASKNKEKREKVKTSKEIQEEKEMEECTFKPSIIERNELSFLSQGSEGKEKAMLSPKGKKPPCSPRKAETKSGISRTSPSNIFPHVENLQTIKETLEDELTPKPNLNSDLENFEQIENMVLEESKKSEENPNNSSN